VNNPAVYKGDDQSRQLEQEHYLNVFAAFRNRKDLTPVERSSLRYLRHALRRNRLSGRPLVYRLAYRLTSWIGSTMVGRRSAIIPHRRQILAMEKGTNVEQNVHQLSAQLRDTGFTLVPEQALQQRLQHQLPRFDLQYADPRKPISPCTSKNCQEPMPTFLKALMPSVARHSRTCSNGATTTPPSPIP